MIISMKIYFLLQFLFFIFYRKMQLEIFFLMIHDTISKNKVNHCDLFSKICIRIFFFTLLYKNTIEKSLFSIFFQKNDCRNLFIKLYIAFVFKKFFSQDIFLK